MPDLGYDSQPSSLDGRIGLARLPVDPSVGLLPKLDDREADMLVNLGESLAMLIRFLRGREPAGGLVDQAFATNLAQSLPALEVDPEREVLRLDELGLIRGGTIAPIDLIDLIELTLDLFDLLLQTFEFLNQLVFLLFHLFPLFGFYRQSKSGVSSPPLDLCTKPIRACSSGPWTS